MSSRSLGLKGSWLLGLLIPLGCSGNSPSNAPGQALGGSSGAAGTNSAASGAGTNTGGAAGQDAAGGAAGAVAPPVAGDAAGGSSAGARTTGGAAGSSGSAGSAGAPPTDLPTAQDFVCSWVLGITTTGEWYKAGFEKVVDDARWQVTPIEMGHLEKWADPNHEIWQSPITSACAQSSEQPDRIVFNATKYEWTTVEEFLPAYIAVVNNIKAKYPSVKRIDLITYGRAPGNVECVGANRSSYSYIKQAQDDAAAMLPAMFPGFVFVAPKWEHKSCSDFGLCPHVSAEANAVLAKTIGEYFLEH
ncbi:MAG TPA: hypothetical protein VHB79_33220 [Polyangiaceae bacterium]|nr:hypothetical protein [Polyangiaceae bacterium]